MSKFVSGPARYDRTSSCVRAFSCVDSTNGGCERLGVVQSDDLFIIFSFRASRNLYLCFGGSDAAPKPQKD